METIAQEAKRILEPIPEDHWTTGLYYDADNRQRCCVIGHIRDKSPRPIGTSPFDTESRFCFEVQLRSASKQILGESYITDVNDGGNPLYLQPTPKQRVMALLDDMISAGL